MDYLEAAKEFGGKLEAQPQPPAIDYKALAAQYGGKLEEPTALDKIVRGGKVAASSLLKGLLSLPAMVGDANGLPMMADLATNYNEPQTRANPELTKKLQGIGPKPESTAEKYIDSVGQGVGSAVLGGGGLVQRLVVGAASGLGSEVAARLAQSDGMLPRLLGGLAGGGAASAATALKTTRGSLAKEALHGLTDEDLVKAGQVQKNAQSEGVSLLLNQAMGKSSNLDKLADRLAQSKSGEQTTRLLNNQPNDVSLGMSKELQALPGEVRSPQIAANNVQQLATDAIQAKKKVRMQAWENALDSKTAELQAAREPAILQAQAAIPAEIQLVKEAEQRLKDVKKNLSGTVKEDFGRFKEEKARLKVKLTEEGLLRKNLKPFVEMPGSGSNLSMSAPGFDTQSDLLQQQTKAAKDFLSTPQAKQTAQLVESPKTQLLKQELADRQTNLGEVGKNLENAQGRLSTAQADYRAVTTVPEQSVLDTAKALRRTASQYPNTARETFLNRVADGLFVNGKAITDPKAVNEVLKSEAAKLKSTSLADSGIDSGTAKWLGMQIGEARDRLGTTFEPIQAANKVYRQLTIDEINPLKKSIIGDLAMRKGAQPDANAAKTKLFSLFSNGTNPEAKVSDILDLEKGIRNLPDGPETFQDAAKTWLSDSVAGARQMEGSNVAPNIAANIKQAFLGDTKKQQGLRDVLVGMARSQGKPEDTYLGMEKFLRIVEAAAKRPSNVAGTSAAELEAASRSGFVEAVSRTTLLQPLRQPFRTINDVLNRDAYSFMDKLLTSPEGVDMLRKLNKQPIMSKAAADTIATFAATHANMNNR
jgi:hypothetical protein